MKNNLTFFFFLLCLLPAFSQQERPVAENLIVITLDGLRWQEVFGGIDTFLVREKSFNQGDSAKMMQRYWSDSPEERRKKLMPFLWSTIATQGQLYGNRRYNNRVDNANPYWFSYPGYSEIFCGYVDTAVNSNSYPPNPHLNVLEYIHQQNAFKGKVAAFCAWDAFDRILNEKRAGFPVVSGPDDCGGASPSPREQLLNAMKRDAYAPFGTAEQLDVFTHYAALEYLQNKRPRVLYIGYGETDEWAHHGHYRDYLDAARQTDQWIADIWNWLQTDPQYRQKTALFITVDHGRGDAVKAQWTSHGQKVPDSHETWFALLGPGITPGGEIKTPGQIYQNQYAQTLAQWLGLRYTAKHPVAEGIWK
ncbi:MAG: alkaline phosphatase family protein [Saprospiraceae bacterium]|nr:alkaline phosphatase family protein [Saprospiraceae bacterium]